MANTLTNAIDSIMAMTIDILRETSVMPRLINSNYSAQAAQQGDSIDIPITSSLSTRAVTPGLTHPSIPASNDLIPTKATLNLNSWHEVPFVMTDKELKEVEDGFQPKVLEEAVRAIANKVDSDILSLYKHVYNYVGVAGTTPFQSSLQEAQEAYRVLTTNKIPKADRAMVLDPFAEANFIGLPNLTRINESGSAATLREGEMGRVMGFNFFADQNIPTHDTGASSAETYAVDNVSGYAVGVSTILIDGGDDALPSPVPVEGDVFTFAGHTQQYVVRSATSGATEVTLVISPALTTAITNNEVLTFVTTDHTVNMAFHRDFAAFASRPLLDLQMPGSIVQSVSDPVSGLSFRMEMQRVYKQTYFSMDILYGYTIVRPEMAVRVLG